ncbi:MAG: MGMT family protein, partial [Hyphomicrobium sp.]
MMKSGADRRVRADILTFVRAIPLGSVATVDLIATALGVIPTVVTTVLGGLSEDERQMVAWYRVVAKGGAIGRGPHRDQQFAKLVREGVPVSPAGIVQDMGRVALTALDPKAQQVSRGPSAPVPPPPLSR